MKTKIAALAAAALTACGGGGTSELPNSGPLDAPCAPVEQVRVQLFGDSTQAGADGSTGGYATLTPAVNLQAAMDARYGRGKSLVTLRAVGGTSAVELVAGTDGMNQPWPESVDADIVVVNHGINDVWKHGDMDAYRAALETLSDAPATVIFETPNIIHGMYDVGPFAQTMREVAQARGVPVADVYAYTAAMPDYATRIPDWAHPVEALYVDIVRDVLAPAVFAEADGLLCHR